MQLVPNDDDLPTEVAKVRRAPAQKPATRKRMSALERREQLITVGRRLFAEMGYESVTVEAIAQAAKVSKPVV